MSALDTQVGGTHYKDCTIQPVQFIEANRLGFLEGCVVKRMARHDKPSGKGRQDIEKAIHELQLLLEHRYPTTKPLPSMLSNTKESVGDCLVCGERHAHMGLPCPLMQPKAELQKRTKSG